jgi:uncharacterized coiled-coil DUF342 family protein
MNTKHDDIPSLTLQALQNIQAELVALRRESKADNAALREELHKEVGGLREEVGSVREEVGSVREEVGSLRREMTDGFTRLRTEIVELRGDVDVGFTAQRMQNDRRFLDHERRLRELEAQR